MRAESYTPTVQRIVAGAFEETAGYETYRSRGTTDWLLIHTLSGRGHFGGYVAQPGDSILLSPGTPHDYGVEPELRRWEIAFAHFHPRPEWLPLLDWPELAPGLSRIHSSGEVEQRIAASLRDAARFSLSGMDKHELFALNSLEAALLWCDTQNPLASRVDDRILRVMEYVDQHIAEPIDADLLAGIARLSVSRFTHLFTDQVGTSPQRYVESQRMNLAMQLLDLTSRPMASIAREVGFSDSLYFSNRFKRYSGLSPTAYRAR